MKYTDEVLINRQTGLPPTAAEWAVLKERAAVILRNPYASPELTEWALKVTDATPVPYETRDDRIRERRAV